MPPAQQGAIDLLQEQLQEAAVTAARTAALTTARTAANAIYVPPAQQAPFILVRYPYGAESLQVD